MIDRKLIDNHPASKLARSLMGELGVTPTTAPDLLQLTFSYLNSLPEDPSGVNEELIQEAAALMNRPPEMGLALLVGDYEQLREDLKETPKGEAWTVLDEHLGMLERQMREAKPEDGEKEAAAKAHVLAENLMCSLEHLCPGFGQPSR
jgi:hypothetical protein